MMFTPEGKRIFKNQMFYGYPVIVTELLGGGEILKRFQAASGIFLEDDARFVFRRLVTILNEIHANGVIHCDLKPENLICTSQNQNDYNFKIIDFDTAITLPIEEERTRRSRSTGTQYYSRSIGTQYYRAPESIQNNEYSKASDIWQAGVILYVMLCCRMPFNSQEPRNGNRFSERDFGNIFDISQFQYNLPLDEQCRSAEVKDLLSKIFKINPLDRISGQDILSHEWLAV
jgi:serine/threonine protein kinase